MGGKKFLWCLLSEIGSETHTTALSVDGNKVNDPVIVLLVIYPKKIKLLVQKDICTLCLSKRYLQSSR